MNINDLLDADFVIRFWGSPEFGGIESMTLDDRGIVISPKVHVPGSHMRRKFVIGRLKARFALAIKTDHQFVIWDVLEVKKDHAIVRFRTSQPHAHHMEPRRDPWGAWGTIGAENPPREREDWRRGFPDRQTSLRK